MQAAPTGGHHHLFQHTFGQPEGRKNIQKKITSETIKEAVGGGVSIWPGVIVDRSHLPGQLGN